MGHDSGIAIGWFIECEDEFIEKFCHCGDICQCYCNSPIRFYKVMTVDMDTMSQFMPVWDK